MNIRRDLSSFDIVLVLLVVGLSIFGIIMVGSATGIDSETQTAVNARIFRGQIMWVIIGIIVMLVVAFIDYQWICRFYIAMYVLNIVLLLLAKVFGSDTANVSRWLYLSDLIPPLSNTALDIGIQPSEFTKLFTIIYLAKLIDKYADRINELKVLFSIVIITAIPIVLIFIQPSLSACLVTTFIVLVMLFEGKVNYRYFIIAVLIITPILLFLWHDINSYANDPTSSILVKIDENGNSIGIIKGYWYQRIINFLEQDAEAYDQTLRSMKAIGSGQLFGKGLFNNNTTIAYSYNDFIFAIIGSELGFVGAMGTILVLFLIVIKCLIIAQRSDLFLGKLIAVAVASMLLFQGLVNVGVSTNVLPNTGMVFPFVSYGGSSMLVNMAAIGLVLSVGMTKNKPMFE